MIFATIPDEALKTQLIEAIKSCTKPHIYRRLLTIQLSAERKKVSELTDIFKVTPRPFASSFMPTTKVDSNNYYLTKSLDDARS